MIAEVYGFGSYFKGSQKFKDIDLLIVHTSSDYHSCLEAISLKRAIVGTIDMADVSILSKSEEQSFNFIDKSKAILLYVYEGESKSLAAKEILKNVQAHGVTH